ncbi:uncharacterized protein K452DRAFT_247935 [Aplosporella prunicola CBS 121167]|uniref:Malate dehydrogenase n=1 Tax=Aplosporella prunicola CBS 121167 TaxID=1176127 RepID=A0A6A6BJ17_9PEZI|nr:uncharacterized protein K452DRAFT_247935 [Aplosporella prunicola CBS 121167]KAF2143403.1 hypothetical protein K452DRAFT_247935 [Aplosporella prunicola CBS 121167]
MRFFSALAVLALAPSCLLALPTGQQERRWNVDSADSSSGLDSLLSKVWQDAATCDLSSVSMPLDQTATPLPSPASNLTLRHVAVGRGTQNYTCAGLPSTSEPQALGAKATLFNATCTAAHSPSLLASTPGIALRYAVPSARSALAAYDALLSGHHFFSDASSPVFDLDTAGHAWGVARVKKDSSTDAPESAGSDAVPWLRLVAKDGNEAYGEVFRLETVGGQPPDTCEGQTGAFEVEYAATYWFWA